MKIKYLFVVFTLCYIQNAFAIELWNGFTDDMTEEQVINRGEEIFSTVYELQERESYEQFLLYGIKMSYEEWQKSAWKKILLFHGDQEYRNDKFMIPDSVLNFTIIDDPALDDSYRHNNQFYFFNKKLYAIYINWNKEIIKEVEEKLKENYGKDYEEIIDYSPKDEFLFIEIPERRNKWLHWDFDEKELYFFGGSMYVISKNHYKTYKKELNRRRDIIKQHETEAKQKKIDGIKF